jgi:multiple sugar transport system permease protein
MATVAQTQTQALRRARSRQRFTSYGILKLLKTIILRAVTYLILADIAFVFLFPVFYMIATSFKSIQDLTDPTIVWIATGFDWQNYTLAWQAVDFVHSFSNSAQIAILAAIGQVIS